MIAGWEDGRDGLGERTRAGLAASAARGRKGGRKPAVTEDKFRQAREHTAEGLAVREGAVRSAQCAVRSAQCAVRMKVGKTALYQGLTVEGT